MYGTHLYILWIPEKGLCKIGRSGSPEKRLAQIQAYMPFLKIEVKLVLADAGHLERIMHEAFRSRNSGGEWFSVPWEEAIETALMYNHCLKREFARPRRKAAVQPRESTCELSSDD